MKKLNGFRKMMAWVLALMMVLGSVCTALADGEGTPLSVTVSKEENEETGLYDITVVVNENIDQTHTDENGRGIYYTVYPDIDLSSFKIDGLPDDEQINIAELSNQNNLYNVESVTINVGTDGKRSITEQIKNENIDYSSGTGIRVNTNDIHDNIKTVEINAGDISVTTTTAEGRKDFDTYGINVETKENWNINVNVQDVKAEGGTSSSVYGIDGFAYTKETDDSEKGIVNITAGSVTSTSLNALATGIRTNVEGSGEVHVETRGAVTASSTNGEAVGIKARGKSDVTSQGEVTATGAGNVTGINADSSTVKADSVSATTTGDNATATGVKATNGTVIIGEEEGATGDVTAKATGENAKAIGIDASGGSEVTASGKVTAEGTESVTGISADSSTVKADSVSVNQTGNMGDVYGVYADNATVIIGADQKAAGGVTVKSKSDSYDQYGIYAEGNADVTVVKGNVDLSAKYGNAIYVQNGRSGAVATVTVKEGNVAGHDSSQGIKILSFNSGKGIVAVENGTVESETQGINVMAASGGQNLVTVQGDVSGNEKGIYAYSNGNESSNTVIAQSDVKGGDNGTGLDLSARNGGVNHILVEGTLSGGTAITLENDDAAADSTVTVWAAESKGDLVAGEIGVSTDTINAFTKAINYIVKLSGSLTNNNVSTDNNKTVLVTEENNIFYGDTSEDYKYHTAKEEEDVTLSFQLREGEVFEGVYYNAEDKDTEGNVKEGANLLTVGNGLTAIEGAVNSFKLLMQRGGGMLLGLKTHTHDYSEFVRHEKEPTCTETGLDLYKCKYCDATITETVAVKSDNHSLADGAAKAVTCTEDGWDAYQYCTRCDYSTKVVIPAGHDFSVDVAAKAASCEEDGYTAHKECSRCHEKNADYQLIKAGHEFEEQLTAGEKTHWYACKNCDVKKGETEHTPGKPVKEKEQAAKVGVAGSYEEVVYCTACGAEISRKTVETDPLPEKKDAIVSYDSQDSDDTIVAEYKVNTVKDDTSLIVKITGAEDQDGEFAGVMLGLLSNMDSNIPDEMKADLEKLQRNLSSAKAAVSIPADISADAEADRSIAAGGPFRAVGTKYPAIITIELKDPDTFVGIMIWRNGKWIKLDTTVNDDGTVTFVLDEPSILCIVYSEVIIA